MMIENTLTYNKNTSKWVVNTSLACPDDGQEINVGVPNVRVTFIEAEERWNIEWLTPTAEYEAMKNVAQEPLNEKIEPLWTNTRYTLENAQDKPSTRLEINSSTAPKATGVSEMSRAVYSAMCSGHSNKIDWLIEGFIAAKKLHLITSCGGVGKSWLLLDAACSISSGSKHVMGDVAQSGAVLYLDLEMGMEEFHRRINLLSNHADVWLSEADCALDSEEYIDRLISSIKRRNIIAVFIDSFIGSHSLDENNNTAMRNGLLKNFKRINKAGAAVIIAAHAKKTDYKTPMNIDSNRGASDIVNMMDMVWGLSASKPEICKIRPLKSRLSSMSKLGTKEFEITDISPTEVKLQEYSKYIHKTIKQDAAMNARIKILDLLREQGAMKVTDIKREIHIRGAVISQQLSQMCLDNILDIKVSGVTKIYKLKL